MKLTDRPLTGDRTMTRKNTTRKNTKQQAKTHRELVEGWNGSGNTVYMVCTVSNETGNWLWIERFDTKAEALHWMKWA